MAYITYYAGVTTNLQEIRQNIQKERLEHFTGYIDNYTIPHKI